MKPHKNIETKFVKNFNRECPLPEYPRPQLKREEWQNLNGPWQYAIVSKEQKSVDVFDGQIIVPFCVESSLSNVQRTLLPSQKLWYQRTFKIKKTWQKKRVLLHFGAVDWQCEVFVNNQSVGTHQGGYLPFTFDISNNLQPGNNKITVVVWDPSDSHWQQKGKQKASPKKIYYTPCSGIWQTVWLEPVPKDYIKKITMTPNIDNKQLLLIVHTGKENNQSFIAKVSYKEKEVAKIIGTCNEENVINIDKLFLWHYDHPHLYDINIELSNKDQIDDKVDSYFGMRKFSILKDDKGIKRLALNNVIVFHHGVLDQGYWPESLYTPPTDEALLFDVKSIKKLGFNMVRKHVKVEPKRWYYYCDKEGLIVWQDMINGGKNGASTIDVAKAILTGKNKGKDITLRTYKKTMRADKISRDDYETELFKLVDSLYNTPSIGMWVPFNEAWGQFDSTRISDLLRNYDKTRTVDNVSGWWDQGTGNMQSHHIYFRKLSMPKIINDRAFLLSEYGGYSLFTKNHVWNDKIFGYKVFKTKEQFENGYIELIKKQLIPLVEKGCCGAVYTQLTDIESEINGFLTYDRKILKVNEKRIKKINELVFRKQMKGKNYE